MHRFADKPYQEELPSKENKSIIKPYNMGNICGKTNFRYATLIFVMSFNRRLLEGSFVDWRMDFMWGDWVGTPRVCLNQQGTTSSNSKSPYNQSKSRLLKELIKITFMLLV